MSFPTFSLPQILALSNALGSSNHWPERIIRKPHPVLVLIYELIITVLTCEIFMVFIWDPLQKHLDIFGDAFLQFGLKTIGDYLKSEDGIEQLKIFIASLLVYTEMIYYETEWFVETDPNEWATASIDNSHGAAGEFFHFDEDNETTPDNITE